MLAINESELRNRLDSGSTKRLSSFRKRLANDDHRRIFDASAVEVIREFSLSPKAVDEELNYLFNLKEIHNGEEIPFSRSFKSYSMMEETWKSFRRPEIGSFLWNEHAQAAIKVVRERYPHAKLRALQYDSDSSIEDAITDLSTSSGWTGIVTGKMKKKDLISNSYRTLMSKIQSAIGNGSFNCPVLPGVRTQCSGEYSEDGNRTYECKHKTRPIWMTDAYQLFAERMFAKPLTEWLAQYEFSAVGKNDEYISRFVHACQIDRYDFISLDYSKYDSTIPSWLARAAFDIVESSFCLTDYERELLHVLSNDFISKNLITKDGVWHIAHGDPSGSGFTTIINGICNEIITETWSHFIGTMPLKYLIMGDDNLIFMHDDIDKSIIASYIKHNFGIIVNVDKTTSGSCLQDPMFLSRKWTAQGPYRNPNILLSMIAYPERERRYEGIKELTPELVIFSYIIAYRAGMEHLIDVGRFLKKWGEILSGHEWNQALVNELPYNVRMVSEIDGKFSPKKLLRYVYRTDRRVGAV